MRKQLFLVIFLISSFFFSVLFQERSQEDIDCLEIESMLAEITNKQVYEFSIFNTSKDTVSKLHNKLLEYAVENKILVKTGYNQYLDNGYEIISNYLYDPTNMYFDFIKKQYEYHGQNIDFSKIKSHQYISTDIFSNADGYYVLFDQNYLKRNKIIYEERCMANFIDNYHAVNDNINYYIYINSESDVDNLKKIIQSYLNETQYASFDNLTENHIENSLQSNSIIILLFLGTSFIIYMFYMFYNQYREMTIVNLLGYKQIEILKNYYFKPIILCFLVLFISLTFYFSIFVSRINSYTVSFFIDLLFFILVFISIFIISIFIFIIFIYKTKKYTYLSSGKTFDFIVFIQLINKTVFMSLFVIFIISSTIPNYPYYQLMSSYYHQKDIIDNVYDIKNIKDDKRYSKILCNNGAIACDFLDILMNKETKNYIPYIIVNEEFLHLYHIYLDIQKPTLIIPNQYNDIDPLTYNQNLDVETFYTNNNYTFYDPSLIVEFPIKNPIILVVKDEYQFSGQDFYLSKDKSIDEYKSLLSSIMDKNDIEIQENSKYIKSLLSEQVYPKVLDNILFISIYCLMYYFLLELLMSMYIKDKEKEISLKIIHGYSYIQIFKDIYFFNFLTMIIPFAISIKLEMMNELFGYFLAFLFVDGLHVFLKTYRLKSKVKLLKEV